MHKRFKVHFFFFLVDNGGFVGLVRCIRGLKLIIFFFFVDNGGFLPLLFKRERGKVKIIRKLEKRGKHKKKGETQGKTEKD
jgi:hypothetical protein